MGINEKKWCEKKSTIMHNNASNVVVYSIKVI